MAYLAQRTVSVSRSSGVRVSRSSRAYTVKTQALFGWGKKKSEEDEWKAYEKEEQFRVQQELLEKRKTGSLIKEAKERRQNVRQTLDQKKAARQAERDSLAQGVIPDSLRDWKNYKKKIDAEGTQGLVVPLLPFGIKEFDEGERFDLRSPYADDGWVEEDELDMWAGFKKFNKKFLNFGGRKAVEEEQAKYTGKPIQWASTFGKPKPEDPKKKKGGK